MGSIWIGTRGSPLALWQANWIISAIEERHPGLNAHCKVIRTSGDKLLDVPLAQAGGKGLFVKEIEEELLEGEIDIAVHSMKDVPSLLPEGLCLGYYTNEDDFRDVIISRENRKFKDLPKEAKIGTSSLRRQSQLLHYRPDFQVFPVRGNVETRLRKLDEGQFDAIVMAAAGLKRLGLEDRITEYLDVEICLPAVCQGILGIEIREEDLKVYEILSFLEDSETRLRVRAERSFLKRLEGGCQVPIGGYALVEKNRILLDGMIASIDGKRVIRESLEGKRGDAEQIGIQLAEKILSIGGKEILEEINHE